MLFVESCLKLQPASSEDDRTDSGDGSAENRTKRLQNNDSSDDNFAVNNEPEMQDVVVKSSDKNDGSRNSIHHKRKAKKFKRDDSSDDSLAVDNEPEVQDEVVKSSVGSRKRIHHRWNAKTSISDDSPDGLDDAHDDDDISGAIGRPGRSRRRMKKFKYDDSSEGLKDADSDSSDNRWDTGKSTRCEKKNTKEGGKDTELSGVSVQATRKRQRSRISWTPQELKHLKVFEGLAKPPDEDSIRSLMEKHPVLKRRTIAQIKSRAWHMLKTGR